jgi:N,N'-diacetyllegionaminate synthase
MRVEIIAEIANAHQGDPSVALELARKALGAGADAVKFQVYSAEELLVQSHPRFDHFKRQSFSESVWKDLLNEVLEGGARVYCDVFGLDSFRIALESGVHGYKAHSSDLGNTPLLHELARTEQRILLAVGGSTVREIAHAVNVVTTGSDHRPVLLHGFQSYPTAEEDTCLARLRWLQDIFGETCDIGLMDHIAGEDPLSMTLPLVAIGMGATVVEKHITLDRAARGVDYYSSLNPDEFNRFVALVRRTEVAVGTSPEVFTTPEKEYRSQVKKHWVTHKPLKANRILTHDDLIMKRVSQHSGEVAGLDKISGRALKIDCPAEYPISRADVSQRVWALVVARMKSSRLPGKAVLDVAGMPALMHLFERLKQAKSVDRIVLCTTEEVEDDELQRLAGLAAVHCHRGQTEDVLARMLGALEGHDVDVVVRVTGDDVLVDPDYLDRAVLHHLETNAEYSDLKSLPSGTEVEVIDASLLRTIWKVSKNTRGTEYLTTYIVDHSDQLCTTSVPVEERHVQDWRLTLDTPEDYQVIQAFLEAMNSRGKPLTYRLDDIIAYFSEHTEVLALNAHVRQRQTPPQVCTEMDWKRVLS